MERRKGLKGCIDGIKDFFYDISVGIDKKIHKNKKIKTQSQNAKSKNIFIVAMLAYPLLHLAIFYFAININSILLAFQEFTIGGSYRFIGFDNLIKAAKDLVGNPILSKSLINSFIMFISGVIIGVPLNLMFSYFFFRKIPLSSVFRVILFLPQIISSIIMSLVFKMFVEGPFMAIMGAIGIENAPNLLIDSRFAFGTMVFYGIWTGFATGTILYSSAMAKVPEDIIEYSRLEGLGMFREMIMIMIPLIWPTITTMLILAMSGLFTNQGPIYAMFGDAAPSYIYTTGYYLFVTVIGRNSTLASYPYASAVGILLTLIAVPITLGTKWLLEKPFQDVSY